MIFSEDGLAFIRDTGIWLAPAAALATGILLLALKPLLQRYALVRPNARSSHTKPTPQGGGAAIVAVTLVAMMIGLSSSNIPVSPELYFVFTAVLMIAVLGIFDDILVLPILPRITLQTAAVLLVVYSLPDAMHIFPSLPLLIERALLVFAGVWFVNLTNFVDGLDWLTVANILPLTVGLTIAALLSSVPLYSIVTPVALGGAMAGFAPFNKPQARVFLGDVGSLPIGLLAGWQLALLAGSGHIVAALLLTMYPVADATLTLMRRALNGETLWEAHRTHFYQRATDRGFSVMRVVALVFATNCTLVFLAILTVVIPSTAATTACLLVGISLVSALLVNFVRGSFFRA